MINRPTGSLELHRKRLYGRRCTDSSRSGSSYSGSSWSDDGDNDDGSTSRDGGQDIGDSATELENDTDGGSGGAEWKQAIHNTSVGATMPRADDSKGRSDAVGDQRPQQDDGPPNPSPTTHLPPAQRLQLLQEELQNPPRKVVLFLRQDDLRCLREAVSELCQVVTTTWTSGGVPPAVESRLVGIVERGEKLLCDANAAHQPAKRTDAQKLVGVIHRQCEDLFVATADLEALLQKLEHNTLREPLNHCVVVRLLERTVVVLAAARDAPIPLPNAEPVLASVAAAVDPTIRASALSIWLEALGKLWLADDHNKVLRKSYELIFHHVLHNEDINCVTQMLHALLQKSMGSEGMQVILEQFVSAPKLSTILSADPHKFIDEVVLPFLSSSAACSSSPADLLTLAANLIADVLKDQEAALRYLMKVDFQAFGSSAFPQALLVAFMQSNSNATERLFLGGSGSPSAPAMSLLRCLAEKRKLGHILNFLNIGQGCDAMIRDIFRYGVLGGGSLAGSVVDEVLWLLCSAEDADMTPKMLLSPLMICHAGISIGSRVQVQYLAMLGLMASASTMEEQSALAVPCWLARHGPGAPDDGDNADEKLMRAMHTSLCELWSFFHDCSPSDCRGHGADTHVHSGMSSYFSARLWDVVAARLRQMCSDKRTGWSLKMRVQRTVETMSHFNNIEKDHLAFLLQQTGKLDKFGSALDAVLDTIDRQTVLRGGAHKWRTADIPTMVFYYYCYAKYPVEDFKGWVLDGLASTHVSDPVHQPSVSDIDDIFSAFSLRRDQMCGRQELADAGYMCVHYSQAFAVQVAIEQVQKNLNPFMRVGTGQGKSLIIALLAAHYAVREGRTVYIFTCYEHLAQRDQARFKSFYEALGVESLLIGQNSTKCPSTARVIYSDLDTFLNRRQAVALEKCKGAKDVEFEDYSALFRDSLDVVLLDEFDSLVFGHSQVGHTAYFMQEVIPIGRPSCESLSSAVSFKASLAALNPEMSSEYWRRLTAAGFDEGVQQWLSTPGAWRRAYDGHDALGKQCGYAGGRLYELCGKQNFLGVPVATTCLALLQSSRCVIGLSGSISAKEVGCFSDCFSRHPSYVEIPPYCGHVETCNRELMQQRNLSSLAWESAVAGDAQSAVREGRPVLVFMHPDNPNWTSLETKLRGICANGGICFQMITEEGHVNDEVLERACQERTITLSSHVAGRGADFVVPNYIKRRGGLHVIIAFEPEQNGKLDARMVDQMKGRTARMGAPGSFSILTMTSLCSQDMEKVKCKPAKIDAHRISTAVFRHMARSGETSKVHWKRYAFCMVFLKEMDDLPLGLKNRLGDAIGENRYELGRKYLIEEVIGLPRFGWMLRLPEPVPAQPRFDWNWKGRRRNRYQPHLDDRPAPGMACRDAPIAGTRSNAGKDVGGIVLAGLAVIGFASTACTIQ